MQKKKSISRQCVVKTDIYQLVLTKSTHCTSLQSCPCNQFVVDTQASTLLTTRGCNHVGQSGMNTSLLSYIGICVPNFNTFTIKDNRIIKKSSLTSYIQLPHEQVWHVRYFCRETIQFLVSHMLFQAYRKTKRNKESQKPKLNINLEIRYLYSFFKRNDKR